MAGTESEREMTVGVVWQADSESVRSRAGERERELTVVVVWLADSEREGER